MFLSDCLSTMHHAPSTIHQGLGQAPGLQSTCLVVPNTIAMSLTSMQTSASRHKQLVEHLDHLLFSLDQPAPSMLPSLNIDHESILAYLHNWLTSQFEPSKWPLECLLHLLHSVLEPTQGQMQGQMQASELQLPLQLAFQHALAPTTPPRSHAALPQSQSQPQPAQSPHAIRARAHMHQLKQLAH